MAQWREGSHPSVPVGQAPVFGQSSSSMMKWWDPSSGNMVAQLAGGRLTPPVFGQVKKINNGAFAIDINGAAKAVGPIDFSPVNSPADIAALITTALAGATCEFIQPTLLITTPAVASPAISYARAPASGTDISALLCLTAATGAIIG